jgi:4-amino-4-deoxy-L-arabinose transferase-like glycosyltransferase
MRLTSLLKSWPLILIWILVFALGFGLRFYKLGEVPVGVYWDEAAILLDAKTIVNTGKDMHGHSPLQAIFPSYGDYKLPVYIWLATASVAVFAPTAFAVRLPSALAGLFSMLVTALLWRALVKKDAADKQTLQWGGLIAATLMAISPWSLQFSRTAFEGHVGQLLLGLSLLALLKTQKSWFWGSISAVIGALAVYSYYSVRFVWPGLLLVAALLHCWTLKPMLLKSISDWWSWFKSCGSVFAKVVVFGAIFALCLLPLLESPFAAAADQFRLSTSSILNQIDWAVLSNQLREQAGNHTLDRVFYHRNLLMLQALATNYTKQLDLNYLFFTGDPNLRHGTGKIGLFYWWLLPALFVGGYWWLTEKPKAGILLISWWLLALLPASVPTDVPHALRSLNALLPITLILTAGVYQIGATLFETTKKLIWTRWIAFSIAVVLVLVTLGSYLSDYYGAYAERSAVAWQGGYRELADAIWAVNQINATTWIETGDEKFYLWLMLLLEPTEPWTEEKYLFTQLGPYHINRVDWKAVVYDQEPMLVVMQTSALDAQIKERNLQPSWIITQKTFDNQLSYSIAGFRWPD